MNTIDSYFLIDDEFIPISEFSGMLPDPNYIDGAIVCRLEGQDIFTLECWDLVDQLWAYIVTGLSKIDAGQDHEVYFPDQPLRLCFENVSSNRVRITVGEKVVVVDSTLFLSTMKRGAITFFSRMKELLPASNATWERYRTEAEMVRSGATGSASD